jgi:hypothetical protein
MKHKDPKQQNLFSAADMDRERTQNTMAECIPFTVTLLSGEGLQTNLQTIRALKRIAATTDLRSFDRISRNSSASAPGARR